MAVHVAFVSQPRDSVAGHGPQRSSVATVLWELALQLASSNRVTIVAPLFGAQPGQETTPEGIRIVRVPVCVGSSTVGRSSCRLWLEMACRTSSGTGISENTVARPHEFWRTIRPMWLT